MLLLHVSEPGGPAAGKTLSLGIAQTLRLNIWNAVEMNWAYPPLLMHAIPALLAAIGWSASDQAARAAAIFSVIYFLPSWLLGSNFHEVRAQLPLTILLLPCALFGLQRLVAGCPQAAHGKEHAD